MTKLTFWQSKNKLLSQCVRNGRDFKYNAPLSSEDDVNMMFAKIQKLSEKDQLSGIHLTICFLTFANDENDSDERDRKKEPKKEKKNEI